MSATFGAEADEMAEALASRYLDAVAPATEAADALEIRPRARATLAPAARAASLAQGMFAGDAEADALFCGLGASVWLERTRALNPRVAV